MSAFDPKQSLARFFAWAGDRSKALGDLSPQDCVPSVLSRTPDEIILLFVSLRELHVPFVGGRIGIRQPR
jgi:hypothetical protein